MKPIFIIILSLLVTSCAKTGIAPAPTAPSISVIKVDTVSNKTFILTVDTTTTYDWFNGTKGTALIKVTCDKCTAIASIGNTTVPFLFNAQGVGQLKYTPTSGLPIYIAVCPNGTKDIKAEIFDAANNALYAYSGVSGNWNDTYIIK